MIGEEEFRRGTLDHGSDYEYLISAYYSLLLALDNSVANYKISSNDDLMGDFDDVVLEVKYQNGEEHLFATQLKHKTRELSLKALNSTSGDFALSKYYKYFKEIVKNEKKFTIPIENFHFTLMTNSGIDPVQDCFINGQSTKIPESDVTIFKNDCLENLDFLNITNETDYVGFRFESSNAEMDPRFFKQFLLLTKQLGATQVEQLITQMITTKYPGCDPNVALDFMNFFKDWCGGKYGPIKLTKQMICSKLAKTLLTPYIPLIESRNIVTGNLKLFKTVQDQFEISFVSSFTQNIIEIAATALIEPCQEKEEEKKLKDLNRKKEILFVKINSKSPLKTISSAIELLKSGERKFILFFENEDVMNEMQLSGSWNILKNFKQIQEASWETYEEMCERLEISLQNRPNIKLKQFLDGKDELISLITVKELLEMLENPLVVDDENKNILPENYVPRFSIPILLKPELIDSIEDDIFILSFIDTNLKPATNSIDIKDYLANTREQNILTCNKVCTQEEFEQVCLLNTNKSCHHLWIRDRTHFEWIRTRGKIDHLKPYQIPFDQLPKEFYISDQELHQKFNNKLNILCADPGMGKSIMLNALRHWCRSDFWVLSVNLLDHVKYFRNNPSPMDNVAILKYFSNFDSKTKFVQRIIEVFLAEKNVVILWDGYDELPDNCASNLISIVESLYEDTERQWIASRNCSKLFLENHFNTLSPTLIPFNSDEQTNYIKSRCQETCEQNGYDIRKVIGVIENIYQVLNQTGYGDLSGVPLQIYMITEIFKQNPKRYMEQIQIVTTVDVCNEFITGKFNLLFEKAHADLKNNHMIRIRNRLKRFVMVPYEAAALQTTFDETTYKNLNLNCTDLLNDIADSKDALGIISNINDEQKAVFVHKTYQEFLVASWLTKNCNQNTELVKKIFGKEFGNIRYMFDTILAFDSKLHLAVLIKNEQLLDNDNDDYASSKDQCGRNLLHTVCSWGNRFPLISIKKCGDCIVTVTKPEDRSLLNEDETVLKRIIKFLLEHNVDPLQKDELLGWNVFEYADASLSLRAVEDLLQFSDRAQIDLGTLQNLSNSYYGLLYSTLYNLPKIFDALKCKPYLEHEDDHGGRRSLLQIAVELNRTDFVSKLLEIECYKV